MTQIQFNQLALQGYKTAPVMRTILSDYDTPLSVYHKVANAPQSYLFESVQGGDKWGRYSKRCLSNKWPMIRWLG